MTNTYYTLDQLVVDALFNIAEHKKPFIGWFHKPRKYGKNEQFSLDALVTKTKDFEIMRKSWPLSDIDHLIALSKLNNYLTYYLKRQYITTYFFNRIFCLAGILPDLVNHIKTKNAKLPPFTYSNRLLIHILNRDIFPDYLALLSIILIIEEATFELKSMSIDQRKDLEYQLERMSIIFQQVFSRLYPIAMKLSAKMILDKGLNVDSDDVYIYDGKPKKVNLFDSTGNAKVILIIGDKGTGKTNGLMRFIHACHNSGYTVLVFGEDKRKEFRFASQPLKSSTKPDLYRLLNNQNEKPQGLPTTIYTSKPKYAFEKNVKDFRGLKKEWNALNGVVLFEDNIIHLIGSFMRWRSENRTKKIVLCLNEAQNFVSSQATTGKEFFLFHKSAQLFVDLRGLFTPVIMNTQRVSKISKNARQFDEIFCSFIDEENERKLIAKRVGIGAVAHILRGYELREKHLFLRVYSNRYENVKFLIAPSQCETNKQTLDKIVKHTVYNANRNNTGKKIAKGDILR